MAQRLWGDLNWGDATWGGNKPGQPYLDFTIVCGLTEDGLTNGQPDPLQFGIPVRGGELWEFSFWACHLTGDPDAQMLATWLSFDTNGVSKGAYLDNVTYAPNGYLLDSTSWVKYRMQHTIATNSDGLTADPSGGVCGYVIPYIWWHHDSIKLNARYVMGVMLTQIQGVGGAIAPLAPDVYMTLGVVTKYIGPDPQKSKLGPS